MNAKRKFSFLRPLCAACTVFLAAALIWQCLNLYRSGAAGRNDPMFSRNLVAEAFSGIAWIFVLWLAVLTVSILQSLRHPQKAKTVSAPLKAVPSMKPFRHINAVRAVLILAAIGLAAAGIANGGMHDVLVKAINICTECIGLG